MRKLFAALTLCAGVSLAQQPVTGSGTAGTAAPGVITVQGISSMIPVSVNLSQEGGSSITATPTAYGSAPSGNVIGVNAYVTNALSVSPTTPSTSATYAFTMYHHTYTGTALNIKGSAGNLYGFSASNYGTVTCFLQFYNNSGVPSIGTGVVDSYMVQAGLGLTIAPGQLALENFTSGIGFAAATADAGSTTTGCTTMSLTAYYQ